MIGENLQEIRKSLHLTQDKMAAGIINRSFYSRVEGGCNSITATALLKLLYAHEISTIEFLQEFGSINPNTDGYQKKITLAYLNGDAKELRHIQRELKIGDKRIEYLIELLITKLEGHSDSVRIEKLSWNLMKKDGLDEENLWLIFHVMDTYDFEDLQGVVETILNKFDFDSANEWSQQLVAQIVVKYLKTCFDQKKINFEIKKMIKFLKDLPDLVELSEYKIQAAYYEKYFQSCKKDITSIMKNLNICLISNK